MRPPHLGPKRCDPRDGVTRVVADGFSFSNGVAMAADGRSILVNETGTYSVHRIYIEGPRKGEREVVLSNLPGFPDNINDLPDGTFLIGLISKRSDWLDKKVRSCTRCKIQAEITRKPQAPCWPLTAISMSAACPRQSSRAQNSSRV